MKKATLLIACLILTAVLLTACGGERALTPEDKEDYLQQALEERDIETVDEELTATLMAEEKVRYAYVADRGDVVEVYIAFVAETDDQVLIDLSKKAKEMVGDKYPERRITVDGSVDVE